MAPRSDIQIRVNPDTPQENKNLPQNKLQKLHNINKENIKT